MNTLHFARRAAHFAAEQTDSEGLRGFLHGFIDGSWQDMTGRQMAHNSDEYKEHYDLGHRAGSKERNSNGHG